jgi:hypothetical protein
MLDSSLQDLVKHARPNLGLPAKAPWDGGGVRLKKVSTGTREGLASSIPGEDFGARKKKCGC